MIKLTRELLKEFKSNTVELFQSFNGDTLLEKNNGETMLLDSNSLLSFRYKKSSKMYVNMNVISSLIDNKTLKTGDYIYLTNDRNCLDSGHCFNTMCLHIYDNKMQKKGFFIVSSYMSLL